MSEEQDDSSKTEAPSDRKLSDAREKGQVTSSREVTNWFMLMAGAIMIGMMAPSMARSLSDVFLVFIERPHDIVLEAGGGRDAVLTLLMRVGTVLALPIGFFLIAAAASQLFQHGLLFAWETIEPKLERISPLAGVRRLFSLKGLIEFVKGLLKLTVIGVVAYWMIRPEVDRAAILSSLDISDMMRELWWMTVRVMIAVVCVMTVIAAADYMYQRYDFLREMRMTKQEQKEEYKQSEGDPLVKGKLKQIRAQRARQRMMANVPKADVVVTNPTHFAVALQYDMLKMNAPKLLAKGVDAVAFRIRDVAKEHNIPIVENPPVARALYAAIDIDEEIPAEHYKAVAQIIGYVFKLKGRKVN
ncbi:MAG: flagellar biosynthesis protein FlhB [Alphaproteobacteria bacterium]|nr:flagellar biosynthesis protein FlhB [Alphaproteobacteria bacterium]